MEVSSVILTFSLDRPLGLELEDLVVQDLVPGSQAEELGVSIGSRIAAIDGVQPPRVPARGVAVAWPPSRCWCREKGLTQRTERVAPCSLAASRACGSGFANAVSGQARTGGAACTTIRTR